MPVGIQAKGRKNAGRERGEGADGSRDGRSEPDSRAPLGFSDESLTSAVEPFDFSDGSKADSFPSSFGNPFIETPYVKSDLLLIVDTSIFYDYAPAQYARWIQEIVEVESPVHQDVALIRFRTAAGLGRVGRRIAAAYENGIAYAVHHNLIAKTGRILFEIGAENEEIEPRDRSMLDSAEKDIKLIPPVEIRSTFKISLRLNYSVERGDLLRNVVTMFGFTRLTPVMGEVLEVELKELMDSGEVEQVEGMFRLR